MPKRFDTRFFMVSMPSGQTCSPDEREMTHGVWLSPEEALAGNLRKEIPLSPPTLITMKEMLVYWNVEELQNALRTRTWGEPILPRVFRLSHGAMILMPWDPMYGEKLQIDETGLQNTILRMGESFSRIWLNEGVWRPVGI
jgi:hypothetical protein